jgi:hypothetical protein
VITEIAVELLKITSCTYVVNSSREIDERTDSQGMRVCQKQGRKSFQDEGKQRKQESEMRVVECKAQIRSVRQQCEKAAYEQPRS